MDELPLAISAPDPEAARLAIAYAETDDVRVSIAAAIAVSYLRADTLRLRRATEALVRAANGSQPKRRFRWFRP